MDTIQYGSYVNTVQAIAGDLAKIGIHAKVNVIPIGDWVSEYFVNAKTYPTAYTWFGCGPDPGSIPAVGLLSKNVRPGALNLANYTNPKADALITTAAALTNPAKRFANYAKLLRILANDEPYVPLYNGQTYAALDSKFTWPSFNGYSQFGKPYITEIKPR
jgi:ABC-type transport system substrate-binding protein